MKTLLSFFVFFALSGMCGLHANDCATAIPLPSVNLISDGIQSGTLMDATWSGGAQCSGPGSRPEVWYSFTAAATNTFIQVIPSGDIDVVIETFDACGGNSINCRNLAGLGEVETARITGLTVGNEYVFAVYHGGAMPNTTFSYSIVLVHIPFIELRSQDCDQFNFHTNNIIRATNPVTNSFTVAGYQWRFTELEAPFNTYELISPNGTNPNYRLLWFGAIQYGRTYDVSVRLLVTEGASVGDYGNTCTIGLQPNVLATQLESQYANQFFNFCDVVGAQSVGVASQYRWSFNDFELPPITVFGDNNSRLLRLQKVPNLRLGKAYAVTVFATVNGDEAITSNARFLIMNNFVPNTGLRQDLYPCGDTYPINSQVQAVEVCSAQSYTWRFVNTSQVQPAIFYTRSDGSRFIRLDWLPDLIPGDSYNVSVRAAQGNLLGDYSTNCNITIGEPIMGKPMINSIALENYFTDPQVRQPNESSLFALDLSGNDGSGGNVQFHISNEQSGMVNLELYDISGKLVASLQERVDGYADIRWATQSLPRGVYVVRAFNGSEAISRKLVL